MSGPIKDFIGLASCAMFLLFGAAAFYRESAVGVVWLAAAIIAGAFGLWRR